jgi:uncharacterized membrane protein YhhN
MKALSVVFLSLFFLFSIADVAAIKYGSVRLQRIFKPLLMPLLLAFYLACSALLGKSPDLFIALAIICGFLGDTFLLGSGSFFTCGLLAFLLGHLFYITAFLRPLETVAVPPAFYIAVIAYVVYCVVICRRLLPFVEKPMKLPVVAYMFFILTMSFTSLLRGSAFSGFNFVFPFIGSLSFIASDSMLAFQNFKKSGPFAGNKGGVAIMITYLAAQFFIALGVLI